MQCGAGAWLVAALAAVAGGCASSASISTPDTYAAPPLTVIETARHEQFDPSPWPDAPLDTLTAIAHDVPAHLMEGRAAEGLQSETPGFRVQIFSSIERDETVEAQENVRIWWREQHEEGAVPKTFSRKDFRSTAYTASPIIAFASATSCRARKPGPCTAYSRGILRMRSLCRTWLSSPGNARNRHRRGITCEDAPHDGPHGRPMDSQCMAFPKCRQPTAA